MCLVWAVVIPPTPADEMGSNHLTCYARESGPGIGIFKVKPSERRDREDPKSVDIPTAKLVRKFPYNLHYTPRKLPPLGPGDKEISSVPFVLYGVKIPAIHENIE